MAPGIEQMLIAAGATAGGILMAAWFTVALQKWTRSRTSSDFTTLGLIVFLVAGTTYFAIGGKAPLSGALIAGSFFGALLTIRAIFGLVRYSRAEDAGAATYKGSMTDLLLLCAAFVPIFGMVWLVGDF